MDGKERGSTIVDLLKMAQLLLNPQLFAKTGQNRKKVAAEEEEDVQLSHWYSIFFLWRGGEGAKS